MTKRRSRKARHTRSSTAGKSAAHKVHHATGKRVRDLPITLDKLQR